MDLKARILEAMKAAMKDRDKVRVAAIRLVRDAIQKKEIDSKQELDDASVISVLGKLVKQREESVEAYVKGGRQDLADNETREIEIIREFMPEPMSPDELREMVAEKIKQTEAEGPSEIGKVMKALKGGYEGRIGGKEVSEEVKRQLIEQSGS
jgi:uncharacterized protein YqeY